ncbi:alpha-1B-glycoprotein isoform X2 [Ovis canadensis]|uniref:alpha-1B-glycoprotein isoform X2 n=1 Tax=Ovis canadensis TaxID=37174 RepID=UPI0037528D04
MSARAALLLLWGLALSPVTEQATFFDPRPSLWAEASSPLAPWANVTLTCQSPLPTLEFQLLKDGVGQEPVHLESPAHEHRFPLGPVTSTTRGLYSCRYKGNDDWISPSKLVDVTGAAPPPAPTLTVARESAQVLRPGSPASLTCVAPLSDVDFQLRRGAEEQLVPRASTSPDRVFFLLSALAAGDGGGYTCRYRLRSELAAWSRDSAPAELVLSDGTLPAPELSAEPAVLSPTPGALVQLRCRAPRAGVRFALVRKDAGGSRVQRVLSPAGPEAQFELRGVSAVDSGNFSCVYVGTSPPFSGSKPSATLELRVDGPLPRPQLRALWTGALTPGRDAVLRCEAEVPDVSFLLLRAGEEEPLAVAWSTNRSADLVLTHVGRQHAGTYSCRYRTGGSRSLLSELSDPVELQVAGS